MARLTSSQESFLDSQKIPRSAVFDATGMEPAEWKHQMKLLGKDVAFGVNPCGNGGHKLRTRHGHCLPCNPAGLRFQNRYSEKADVYIAGSRKLKLIKVGFSKDVKERKKSLNSLGYAGGDDWVILYRVTCGNAGRVEFEVQKELSRYSHASSYQRDGKTVNCLETFSCRAEEAITALKKLTNEEWGEWENSEEVHRYDFAPTKGKGFVRKGGRDDGSAPMTKGLASEMKALDSERRAITSERKALALERKQLAAQRKALASERKALASEREARNGGASLQREAVTDSYGVGSGHKPRGKASGGKKGRAAKNKAIYARKQRDADGRRLAADRSEQVKQRMEWYKEIRSERAAANTKSQLPGSEKEDGKEIHRVHYILVGAVAVIAGLALFSYVVGLALTSYL